MLDYISMRLENIEIDEYKQVLEKLNIPIYEDEYFMTSFWGNMRMKYYPEKKMLLMKNSIHKLYNYSIGRNVPINWDDFNLYKALQMKEYIVFMFERPASDFKLFSRFEWGVNIETEVAPSEIFSRYYGYNSKAVNSNFNNVSFNNGKGKDIQRELALTEWRIKFYNKAKQSKLPRTKIMRYEIVFHEVRKLRKILNEKDVSLETITIKENWLKLQNELIRVYDSVKKIPFLEDGSNLSIEDYLGIYFYCNATAYKDVKRMYGESKAKKMRLKYKNLYDQYDGQKDNIHNLVREKIVNKTNELLSPKPDDEYFTTCYDYELTKLVA
ncbi:MAG: hypothetical protein NTU43_03475 [Bacteroidetes bacterium]|nr:hypothetical protein [Bacteroidota bacterium]